jgi:hypothetical protein
MNIFNFSGLEACQHDKQVELTDGADDDVCFCYFPVTTTFKTQVSVTSLMG